MRRCLTVVCLSLLLAQPGLLPGQCGIPLITEVPPPLPSPFNQFGIATDLQGDVLVVGERLWDGAIENMGAVHVYRFDGSLWQEEQTLTASDASENAGFGSSVSLFQDRILIGAPQTGGAGAAYIFEYDGSTWSETQKLESADLQSGDELGFDVALIDYFAFVGAPGEDTQGPESGSAYIFHFQFGSWVQIQKLAGIPDPDGRFGHTVAADGIVAAVAGPEPEYATDLQGYVKMYRSDTGVWNEEQTLLPSAGQFEDAFGFSLALEGDELLVGAPEEFSPESGAVYSFYWDGIEWVERQRLDPLNPTAFDSYGFSVALEGSLAVVGAPRRIQGHDFPGSVYALELQGDTWVDLGEIEPAIQFPYFFGWNVALDGERALITSGLEASGPVEIYSPLIACGDFLRGDCNGDGVLAIADAIFNQNYMFLSGETPGCLDACDTNDDGVISLPDSIVLLTTLFLQGPPPPAPYPECGDDGTSDALDCEVVTGVACP